MWIAFIKWMPIICLIDHFSETALVVFVSTIEKRLQNQVYRQWKANLWIHLDLAKVHRLKGLTSPYIISYLHFLNLNNILTLPPPNFGHSWSWVWLDTNDVRLAFCLPDLHACMLVYKIKTNASAVYRMLSFDLCWSEWL